MGTFKKGILGSFSGKVGTVIGSTWRNLDVMKSLPKKSSKPPVQAQIDQRFKFSLITKLMAMAKSLLNIGYQSGNKIQSPVNTAVQYHLKNAISGISPNFTVNYSRVVLSTGSLPSLENAKVTLLPQHSIKLTWDALTDLDAAELAERNKDGLMLILYSPAMGLYTTREGQYKRAALTKDIVLPGILAGNPLHIWLFVASEDEKKTSYSQYLGAFNLIDE